MKTILFGPRMRRALRDIVILILLVWGIGLYQSRNLLSKGTHLPGRLLVSAFSGTQHDLSQLLGKKSALLYFWAPWCGVCKLSIANAVRATRWNGNHNQIFLIALDFDERAEVERFVNETGLRTEDVYLGGDDVRDAFSVTAYPTYYLVGADGLMRGSAIGYSTTVGTWLRLFAMRWNSG